MRLHSEGTVLSPEDSTLCQSIIGILMYLASDRPDIQFTVNELAGMMSKPTKETLEVNISRGIFSKPVSMGSSSPGVGMTLMTWWYGRTLTGQVTRKQESRELRHT